jgi:hypothetical protein
MGASPEALDDQHDTPWLVTGVTALEHARNRGQDRVAAQLAR